VGPKEGKAEACQHQHQEQRIEQSDLTIRVSESEPLIKIAHAGTLGSITKG
jgi:hypothetical protein